MSKVVTVLVSGCSDCPFFVEGENDGVPDWCNALGRIIDCSSAHIPDWCPMEDASDE